PTPSNDPLPSGEDRMQLTELMNLCTNLQKHVLDLENAKTAQAKEIVDLKNRVKKLEIKKKSRTSCLQRLYKVGLSARIVSSNEECLGDPEDASKQGRIAEIDADEDLSLINETTQDQGRMNEEDLFGVNDLDGDEVIVDVTIGENVEHEATVVGKEVSIADPVTTAEPEKPLKKKDQIALDEEIARKLEAQMKADMEKEQRIEREKDEANIDTEGSSKRSGDEIEQESAKRQRLEKEDDTAELKRCLEIAPEDDDDVTIKATPLSSKSPTIVDYKIYREWKKSYFKIIRADGNSQNYLTFRKIFKIQQRRLKSFEEYCQDKI
nr:hypothetical protein [Tanacetum cinerariifolium]